MMMYVVSPRRTGRVEKSLISRPMAPAQANPDPAGRMVWCLYD
jgi:hypothetical protein